MPNPYPCQINKERLVASYNVYGARLGKDSERAARLGLDAERIKARDSGELWKLWVLANLYQRVRETVSEERFVELVNNPGASYLFSSRTVDQASAGCGCPHLRLPQTIHQCDYNNKKDMCAYPQHKSGCIVKKLCHSLARHPSYRRIACTLAGSSLFLRSHGYDFDRLKRSMAQGRDGSRLLQALKDMSGLSKGQKVPSMFLAWLSNPTEYYIWDLDYSDFIPIDLNVRRVAERTNGCKDDQAAKGYVQDLATRWDLNVRVVELAFLNVGQEYCHKNDPSCHACTFGPGYGDDRHPKPVRSIHLKEIAKSSRIETEAQWEQIRDRLDKAVREALTAGNQVEIE